LLNTLGPCRIYWWYQP